MTDGAPYNRRPEGRRSGDVGDAGILLTDTTNNLSLALTRNRRGDDSKNLKRTGDPCGRPPTGCPVQHHSDLPLTGRPSKRAQITPQSSFIPNTALANREIG